MTTFETAAEELLLKVRGLDTEIEESEHQLVDLRDRMLGASAEVAGEWLAFTTATVSFLAALDSRQNRLGEHVQSALAALDEAGQKVVASGAAARDEIAKGGAQLTALAEHAAAMEPHLETLLADAGEVPARELAEHAQELQQQLQQALEETRAYLRDAVGSGLEELAALSRESGAAVQASLGEHGATALQDSYTAWENAAGQLEEEVVAEGFEPSHQHALDVVDYAREEHERACREQVDELQQLVDALVGSLQTLTHGVQETATALVTQSGAELARELDEVLGAGGRAVVALDAVKQYLASYTFTEM